MAAAESGARSLELDAAAMLDFPMVTAERAFASGAGLGPKTKPPSRETQRPRQGVEPLGRVDAVNVGLVHCARAVADTGRLGLGLRDNRRDGIFLERVFENLVERAHVGDL